MAIPMLKIRRPNGRLIFNMEIAIRRQDGLYIETGPRTSGWVVNFDIVSENGLHIHLCNTNVARGPNFVAVALHTLNPCIHWIESAI